MAELFNSFLSNPRNIGSIAPSSKWLARAMAQQAQGASYILELGAGTGPITHALVAGCSHSKIVSVEMCPRLALKIKELFPSLDVRCAAAQDTLRTLDWQATKTAVVSSLPFRSLPPAVVSDIVAALMGFLTKNPESWLIQFTYREGAPFLAPDGWVWHKAKKVWLNTPPASVWVLRKLPSIQN